MRCSRIVAASTVFFAVAALVACPIAAKPQGDVMIFRNAGSEAALFHPYTLRVLAVWDPGNGTCFARGADESLQLICQPIANASIKAVYLETGEVCFATTSVEGIAELRFRIITPAATFRVEVLGHEAVFKVPVNPFSLVAVMAFASMVTSLIVFLRRGFW